MSPIELPPARVQRPFRGLPVRGPVGRLLFALSLSLACGQAGLAEAEAPLQTTRPLLIDRAVRIKSEVLRASVELFGLQIATLESAWCGEPAHGPSIQTRVDASPLVKVIRRTGGEARTELNATGGAARASDYTFRDGDLLRHYKVDYRAGGYRYVYDNGGAERRVGADDVPEGAEPHDLQSAMLLLRSWRPRLDEHAYFYVVLGRRPWRVDVTSRGPEMIEQGGDHRLTYRIDGVAERLWQSAEAAPKHFSLWLSEDAARTPLRMVADASFGQITMTLTGSAAGEAACAVSAATRDEPTASVAPPRIGQAWSAPSRPAGAEPVASGP
jgi:uncharacterized protein DUF3108